jgi:hypothetical protein
MVVFPVPLPGGMPTSLPERFGFLDGPLDNAPFPCATVFRAESPLTA